MSQITHQIIYGNKIKRLSNMSLQKRFCLLFVVFSVGFAATCSNPPTASQYSVEKYEGKWFEVAKYQTAGGAYFERNCTCTEINIKKLYSNNVNAYQGCVRNGNQVMVNATLTPTTTPGHYIQKIGLNSVGYWVLYLDQEYAVTYDCNSLAGITNYCIHILSKNPHVDLQTIKKFAKMALDLGLNKNNLQIEITNQSDQVCSRTDMKNIFQSFKSILRKQ